MEELENKIIQESNVFKSENTDRKEIGYFIYNKYIVSVYRLYSIIDDDKEEGSFENVYVIFDTKTGEVFDEYSQNKRDLFEELPQIDDVQFSYDFDNMENVEKYKKQQKEAVVDYYKRGSISDNYKNILNEILKYMDDSSVEFYTFFIKNI